MSRSCIEPPICAVTTGLGWKGAWLGLQYAVYGMPGSWCVTTEGAELTIHVTKAYVSGLLISLVFSTTSSALKTHFNFFLVEKV